MAELDGTSSLGPLVGRWHLESPCTWVQLLLLRMRSGCAQVLPLQVGLRDTRGFLVSLLLVFRRQTV